MYLREKEKIKLEKQLKYLSLCVSAPVCMCVCILFFLGASVFFSDNFCVSGYASV